MRKLLTILSTFALLSALLLAAETAKPGTHWWASLGLGACAMLFVNLVLAAARRERPDA